MNDPVTDYARAVAGGRIAAGKWQRLACERHLQDLDRQSDVDWLWKFDPKLADKTFRLFRLFRHYKGEWAGQRIELEPWQKFIVGSLIGWITKAKPQTRRFRNAFIEVPRGQGKSTLAGGLLLKFAFFDNEGGADCFSIATKKDQARVSFHYGRQMALRAAPVVRKHITVSKYNLHNEATESRVEALGADADTLDGLRPHFVVADEVHKMPSANLIEVMESGMGTRRQPLLFEITTAGEDDQSVYGQHVLLSQRVLERTVPLEQWFAFIAAADPDDDWTLESTWRKANPNYGVSVKPEFLSKECAKALANPAEQAKFRRLYLGQKTQSIEGYFSLDDWKACPPLPDDAVLRKAPCWIGLDLSSSIDVTAAVLLWELSEDEIAMKPIFWLPEENLVSRAQRDRVPYDVFASQDWLNLTSGNVIDRPTVRRKVAELAKTWAALTVAYDPWHAQELAQHLQDHDGLQVIPITQSFQNLSQPMKTLQAKILQRRCRHDHNPLMALMVSNVIPRQDERGNVSPSKKRSRGRIDGVQAMLNAMTQMASKPAQPQIFFLGA